MTDDASSSGSMLLCIISQKREYAEYPVATPARKVDRGGCVVSRSRFVRVETGCAATLRMIHIRAARMETFLDLEVHRDGFGLLPDADDLDPGLALWIPKRNGRGSETRMCSCAAAKRRMCGHQRQLLKLARRFDEELPGFATQRFEASALVPLRRPTLPRRAGSRVGGHRRCRQR